MQSTVQAKSPTTRSQPQRSIRDPRKRLHVLAWNSTGLASWKLDELHGWLHGQPFQLVVVSETRWQYDREWTEDGWFHVACSGSPFRSCGLLEMVRTSFCTSTQISWQSLIPGRLLHLRIHLDRPLDVIGCYQHTFVHQAPCKQNRNHWVRSLDTLLHDIPKRNNLVVLGDWNCSLPLTHPHIGVGDFVGSQGRLTGPTHPDWKLHLDLIQTHDLCGLNTWRTDSGPSCCTAKGDLSRIDYVFTRMRQSDREALEAMPIETFDVLVPSKIGHRLIDLLWARSTWLGNQLQVQPCNISHTIVGSVAEPRNRMDLNGPRLLRATPPS